jgi:hypothetical protein
MTPFRRVRFVLSTLLIASCAAAAWANPPAAIPNTDPAHQRAERSFHEFATGWMQKMEKLETANRAKPKLEGNAASYRGYADGFQIELRPTGSSTAPWSASSATTRWSSCARISLRRAAARARPRA